MEQMPSKIYHAAIYLRLSHSANAAAEDGRTQSNSISNQKELIKEFLKSRPDIQVIQCFTDDGYSGVDFNRPNFQKMLEAIKKGGIDCVIVKDLSRFGRNYIDAGNFIEKLFPMLGVRFIAINDNYDSANDTTRANDIVVPFKNLINDAYCRDISIKIRSHLEIKRKKGEFIGAFTVYGYCKNPDNRNKLMVDPYAAEIVKEVYKKKLGGMSAQAIANYLNELGILSPAEYKKSKGIRYQANFQTNPQTKWTAVAVGRILKNDIYLGILTQGKESTPNYKIKRRLKKAEEDWIRIEQSHEPIITEADFTAVQNVLKQDTRISPAKKNIALYAGFVTCGDCGNSMVRKTVPAENKRYCYYVCSGNKQDKDTCSSHRINEKDLEEAIRCVLREHIQYLLHSKEALQFLKDAPGEQKNVKNLDGRVAEQETEITRYEQLKIDIYEDMCEGILSKEEFLRFKKEFEGRKRAAEQSVLQLKKEIENILCNKSGRQLWIEDFMQYRNFSDIDRLMVVHLIQRIYIYEDARIEVVFRYQDEMEEAAEWVKNCVEETYRPERGV